MRDATSHQEFAQIKQTHCCFFIHNPPVTGESNHYTHIVIFLFIIAYYCGFAFAAAEAANRPYLPALNGPLDTVATVSFV